MIPLSRQRSNSLKNSSATDSKNGNPAVIPSSPTVMERKKVKVPLSPTISNGPVYALERNGLSRGSISSTEVYDIGFKVMLVGDSGVGKTCMLIRYKDGAFLSGAFISTVGIDFRNKVMEVDEMKVKLQIWDTAGQERFRSVTHTYYRDAHALLLLYDVTNRVTFDNTRAWVAEIKEHAHEDVVIMLIGNKAEMERDRQVKFVDAEKLAHEYGITFMETSAKTGLNVDLCFNAIARELKYRYTKNPGEPKFNVTEYVKQESQKPKAGCCM